MKVRILSLLFAGILPMLPMARVFCSAGQAIAPEVSVILRFVIGATATLGAFDAVSGASTVITSPNTATGMVGQAFSYRITVGPRAANIFRAVPLPEGLYMERSFILGVPTIPGETQVKLTASDGGHAVSKWITIYILPPPDDWPPVFNVRPRDESAVPGETTTFHSVVYSHSATTFQWLFNGEPIAGATDAHLTFVNDPNVFAGTYAVIASNPFGSATSPPVRLFIRAPLVDSTAVWSYSDTGKPQPASWRKITFKDSLWPGGVAPFGYGWGDENTLVSTGPSPLRTNITTYFRHKFVVSDSNAYAGFNLALQADDGAVLYLNGKELMRRNMKAKGGIPSRMPALSGLEHPSDREWFSTNIFQPLVIGGTNLFAIEVHQAKTNGSDLRFYFRFSGLKLGP